MKRKLLALVAALAIALSTTTIVHAGGGGGMPPGHGLSICIICCATPAPPCDDYCDGDE